MSFFIPGRSLQLSLMPNEEVHPDMAKTQYLVVEDEEPFNTDKADALATLVAKFTQNTDFIHDNTELLILEFTYTRQAADALHNLDEKRYLFCYEVRWHPVDAGVSLEFVDFDPKARRVWDKPTVWGNAAGAAGGAGGAP
jgi:hypothetical protein